MEYIYYIQYTSKLFSGKVTFMAKQRRTGQKKELLSLTNDRVFRTVLGEKNIGALADFLSAVLDVPEDEFDRLVVDDPNLHINKEDGKSGQLDIRAHMKGGEIIHIEVQVNPEQGFRKRIVYYNDRLYVDQLSKGGEYYELNRTISIIITDHVLLRENQRYSNKFMWYNKFNELLINDQEIIVLELPKLPPDDDNTKLWNWLKFLT